MADSSFAVTAGSGTNIDGRTESTNGDFRQVIVLGDPSSNNAVASVQATDPSSNVEGLVVRDVNTSALVGVFGGSGIKVRDIVTGTIATVTSVTTVATLTNITNSVAVHVLSTGGTINVSNTASGTIAISAKDGTIAVYFSPNRPAVLADAQHTAGIFTVSGSTSGVSVSGVTLVSPSASYNFKVFAFSITTTGIVHMVPKFTNGSGSSPTELWRVGLQGPAGANLAVSPPSYLFATGTNTTLSLVNDTASLIHYSVSYIKESA